MKLVRFGAVVLAAASLSACATITRGTQEKFAITSDPDGATVEMTNGLRCTTPCKMKVNRKSDFVVKVAKEGYEPAEVRVQGKVKGGGVAGGVLGNAIFGGLIGAGVDASTGAMLNLTPNPVQVKLKPLSQAVTAATEANTAAAPAAPAPAENGTETAAAPTGTPQF